MAVWSTCWVLAEFCLSVSALAAAPAQAPPSASVVLSPARIRFNIPAQTMDSALHMWADQADVQLLYATEIAQGLRTKRVSGDMTPEAALDALLAGTRLVYTQETPGVFTIEAHSVDAGAAPGTWDRKGSPKSAHNGPGPVRSSADISWLDDARQTGMLVLGTMIRDAQPLGTPPIRLDRSDIERTGFSTLEELMRTVPQNWGGGPTEDTFRGLEAETNSARGYALNLRGLGAGSTLVLYDGRRLASGGSEGSFTDVSNIPLASLEMVEILPNGASAIYGSDAVGGVVNLVPRRDFVGAESQARAGAVTTGSMDEYQFGQTFGTQWEGGRALLSVDYFGRSALATDQRDLARSDLRAFGGDDFDTRNGNPGTILDGGATYAIPPGQDGRSLSAADFVAGSENRYDLRAGSDLLPEQDRLSAIGFLRHDINDRLSVFADAIYARRRLDATSPGLRALLVMPSTNPFYVSPSGSNLPIVIAYSFERDLGKQTQDAELDTANIALGAALRLGESWQVKAYLGSALERQDQHVRGLVDFGALAAALADTDPATAFDPLGDGSFTNPATLEAIRATQRLTTDSELRSINVKADGPVLEFGGGKAMLALGVDRREQTFESSNVTVSAGAVNALRGAFDRSITSVFGELRIPFFGSANRRPGLRRLEMSLAARYEDYSDFGHEAVPALGLAWSPVEGLGLRASWSKSFKAPNLADLDETNNLSQIFPLLDPEATAGPTPMLLWSGKNADLQEETARSWTAGLDLVPPALAGLSVALTYFDIRSNDRVQEIASAFPNLSNPRLASFVNRNPTAAQREAVCSRSTFFGSTADCLAAPIGAILDLRIQNIAENRTRGIDMPARYEFTNALGDFSLGVNGTWLFEFSQALSRSGLSTEMLDTQNNPLDLRVRSTLSWSRLGMGATLAANYADGYRDVASQPARAVGSWTTYDLQLRYDWDQQSGWLSGTSLSLSIQNLFDEDPPFLNNQLGIGYDQENADLNGRFVRLYVKKSW